MYLEPHFNNQHSGWIEVICGSMFSGKTEELIRRLKRVHIAGGSVAIFKPSKDNRFAEDKLVSHDENSIDSINVQSASEIVELSKDQIVVGIDEAQFFESDLLDVIQKLADAGKRVIIAGLDTDYTGAPFHPMPEILAVADTVTKVHAICTKCGSLAAHSHRKSNEDGQVLLGAREHYEPLCRKCFLIERENR